MDITIDGLSGAGKNTVAEILKEKIGFTVFDCGLEFRAIAQSLGKSIVDVIQDDEYRKAVYAKCGAIEGSKIIVGRDGAKWYPDAFKVYLDCPSDIREARIKKQGREFRDHKLCTFFTKPDETDMRIETQYYTPEQVAGRIRNAYKTRIDRRCPHCGTCTCIDMEL